MNTTVTRMINLTKCAVALVDDGDFDELSKKSWCLHSGRYAAGSVWKLVNGKMKSVQVLMHRFIMNPPDGMDVDHINGNKLDNRRSNLRVCTRSQNGCNRKKAESNRSGYKGVSFCPRTGRWRAAYKKHGVIHRLGRFESPELAHKAYASAVQVAHGEFANVN